MNLRDSRGVYRTQVSTARLGKPLVTLGLRVLSTQIRVFQRAVRTQEDSLSRVHTFSSTVISGSRCHIQISGIDCPIQGVWERVCPLHTHNQESAAGGHTPEKKLLRGKGGGMRASSLIPGRWRRIPFWASVSPSAGRGWRGWLEGYGTLQLPPLSTAHWPARHGANTVGREANL